jgi:hypothetical protein
MVREHDQATGYALFAVLLMGIVSAYAWWRMLRRDVGQRPPVCLRAVLVLVAAF